MKLADLPVRVINRGWNGNKNEKRGPKTTPELSRIRRQRSRAAWRERARQKKAGNPHD